MTTALLLRELLRRLVLPPGGPMLLMLAGFLIVRRRRRVGGGLLAIGFLSLWLLATPWVAERLLLALQTEPVLDLTQPSGAQAVVILGGGVRLLAAEYGGDAPSDDSLRRIAFGAYVAKRTGTPILVSGGAVTGGTALASTMKQFLERDFNTPVRWAESTSLDTHQNAVFSAALLRDAQIQRVILVTSADHMRRAAAEFRATGLQVVAAPTGVVTVGQPRPLTWLPSASALRDSQLALYEILGEWVRLLRFAAGAN